MADINVLPADTLTVINKTVFTEYDQKIITILYQPIIGSLATSLYFSLVNFVDQKIVNHYYLMTSMKLNLDIILEARKKLEGIGLLKTYYAEENGIKNFIYELYSPLSAYEFITSPLLSTLLMNNIGKKEYEYLVKKFQINTLDLKNYKNITASFSDVFKIKSVDTVSNIDSSIEKKVKNEINVKADIDLKNIFCLIPDDLLNKKSITKEIISLINDTAYVYNLDDEAVKEIIINSIDISHKINISDFKRNARNYYEFDNSGKVTNLVYKKQPRELQTKLLDTSNKSKLIYSLENTSPYDFLASKYTTGKPTKSDLKIIEYLLVDLKIKPGVINVLIDYILRTHDNKLTKAYVDAVASQWLKSHIETTKDALEIAKKEYKNIQKINNRYRKSETPKWVNAKLEDKIATPEEQEEMAKMIKELVGEK